MKIAKVQQTTWQMPDDLYEWYTREGSAEVGPQAIWEWHQVIGAEMSSFIHYCRERQPSCFIDIGAHCGVFSSVYCSIVAQHNCHAIEPIADHMKRLRLVASANDWRLEAYPIALNSQAQELYYYNTHMANFVTNPDFQPPKDSNNPENEALHKVSVTTLDNFIETGKIVPQLIKIDTEGYEVPILKGAINTLQQYPVDLFMETHRDECDLLGWQVGEICNFLKPENYTFYTADFQYEIEDLYDYVTNFESNTRFIALNKKTLC